MKLKNPNLYISLEKLIPKWVFYVVIALSSFLRLIVLRSDPPLDLAKGQSLWTDPSQYVFFARNLIKFGHMDSFVPSNLIFFKYSFVSFLSIPIFYIFGTGFWQSNLVSAIISIAMIYIFGITIKNSFGNFVGCVATLFAGTSYVFTMHNRVPYLENASLLFLSISTYYIILKYENRYGLALSGFFLSCSILIGKTLAVLAMPAFIILIVINERLVGHSLREYITKLFLFISGFSMFAIIATALFYLPNYLASRNYLAENVINYYGFPDGLKSINGFINSLYTFDLVKFENTFFDRLPVITICALLFPIVTYFKKYKLIEKRAVVLFTLWFVGGCLFLSPWNYRPIRYEMYLVLPMATMATLLLYKLITGEIDISKKRAILLVIPLSMIVFHIIFNLSHAGQSESYSFWKIFASSVMISIPIAFVYHYFIKCIKVIKIERRMIIVAFIIILSLSFDGRYFIKWSQNLTYSIDYANNCVKSTIGSKAVIIGPYAQTLTMGTTNKSEIYYFGAYPKDDSLFSRIPATHVVFEAGVGGNLSSNEAKFAEYYSKINTSAELIDSYMVGRYYVNLFNITKGTDNSLAKTYNMTDFEIAMYYYNRKKYDLALEYLDRIERIDNSNRASLYKGNIYYSKGNYNLARTEYAEGLKKDCYDPIFWALYSLSCKKTGDINTARIAKEKAYKYAPFPEMLQNLIN